MSKVNRVVSHSFITNINLNASLTFVFLGGCNPMSHIGESAVLMENNLAQLKKVDILYIYCCFAVVNFAFWSVNLFIKNYRSANVRDSEPLL